MDESIHTRVREPKPHHWMLFSAIPRIVVGDDIKSIIKILLRLPLQILSCVCYSLKSSFEWLQILLLKTHGQTTNNFFMNLQWTRFFKVLAQDNPRRINMALKSISLSIFTNPSARAGYDTRSNFKRSSTGLNSEFSFS